MALQVLKAAVEDQKGVVIIEGDNAEEIASVRARQLAYAERVKLGMPGAGINDLGFAPVLDKDGEDDAGRPKNPPTRFQRRFELIPPIA